MLPTDPRRALSKDLPPTGVRGASAENFRPCSQLVEFSNQETFTLNCNLILPGDVDQFVEIITAQPCEGAVHVPCAPESPAKAVLLFTGKSREGIYIIP